MSAIQNFKNFIRHGKQAPRVGNTPHGDPTTDVSNVHAQKQTFKDLAPQYDARHEAYSEPNIIDHQKPLQGQVPHGDYSVAAVDNRNIAAQAGEAAARAAGDRHKEQQRQKGVDSALLERIVSEERESKNK